MGRFLNEEALINVIWGATLLGGGGGGSLQSGLDMLEAYKKAHPDKELKLELITYEEMEQSTYAAVTAGMGSPQAIIGLDFSKYAINAFELLQVMAKRENKELKYSIPVELGGFNTFVPMLISLVKGIPFIDADGAGRAVPALETLLLHVNGCATSPLAMANDVNDKITIELSDSYNAPLAEKLGRDVCIEFGMKSGLSGWMVTADDIRDKIVDGSISLVEKVGKLFRAAEKKSNCLEDLAAAGIVNTKVIGKGKVVEVFTDVSGGFDYGYVLVAGEDGKEYKVDFQNENLLVSADNMPLMTVPDIIGMYCIETLEGSLVKNGMPLSNADVQKGMIVGIGAIKVNEKWFKDAAGDKKWWTVWNECMEKIKYTGGHIPFEAMKD